MNQRTWGMMCPACETFESCTWNHWCTNCRYSLRYKATAVDIRRRAPGLSGLLGYTLHSNYGDVSPSKPIVVGLVVDPDDGDPIFLGDVSYWLWTDKDDPVAIAIAGGGLLGGGHAMASGTKVVKVKSRWLEVIGLRGTRLVSVWQGYARHIKTR